MKSHTTILSITFGFLIINLFLESTNLYNGILILIGLCLISTKISTLIENCWLNFSWVLSKIIPNILLVIIYMFFLTPISILSKIFNSKTDFKSKNDKNSMFIVSNRYTKKNSFNRGW